ncbi:MAG: hypothetical protein ACOX30_02030 [Dethiobacteria bacterium]|jgi:hypothetical protein
MMGCSKSSGHPGLQQRRGGERYSHPVPLEFKPMQIENTPGYEVVCIKADKIYERCKSVETNEVVTELCGIAVGAIEDVWCIDAELVIDAKHHFKCEKIPNTNRAKISFWYRLRFAYIDQAGQKIYTSKPAFFEKTVILSDRILDKRLFVQCEVFLECFECFVSGPQQVTCCIGQLILVKLIATVELMIPAFGFCCEPDDCTEVETECPGFLPYWPPFPPQPGVPGEENGEGNNNGNGGNNNEGDG